MRTALAEEEHPDRLALRTDGRTGARERPRRGLRLPLLGVATAAAVAAGAVTVVALRPDDGPARAPGGNGSTVPQGNVLLVAVTNAQKAPGGRYWHTKTIMGESYAVGASAANHYRVDSRQGNETWTGQNGRGRGVHLAPKQLGTYRRQFVIYPAAGTLLAIRDLVATSPRGSRKLPTGDDGKPRALRAENMPDRFHRPGELAAYQVFEVTEWTNAGPPRR